MNPVLFLSFALLGLSYGASAQSCWVEGHQGESTIELPALAEDTPVSTTVAQFQLVNHSGTATITNPFNKYLSSLLYSNGVYVIAATNLFKDFVTTERVTQLSRVFRMTCADNTTVTTTLVFPVTDSNNWEPSFNQDSYEVTIRLPLIPSGNYTLVRTDIVVSDKDVLEENADVFITSSSRFFPFPSPRRRRKLLTTTKLTFWRMFPSLREITRPCSPPRMDNT